MNSFEFCNVKAEKEDALWRYNMEKKLRIGLHLIGFLLVLFLLSWSWFPTLIPDTVAVAGDFRRRFISTFNKPLFTFVVVNIIIVVVYVLSRQKQTQKQTGSPDMYDEYVISRRSISTSVASAATEETMVDKHIVLVENATAVISPVKQQQRSTTVDTVTETKTSLSPVKQRLQVQPTTMVRTVTKTTLDVSSTDQVEQKEYRRTRSMVSEARNQRPRPREFRRTDTALISRELLISGTEPPRKSMDEMSSEEFQLIIDSFIAEKKKTLMQENTAHFTRRKDKCISIVVNN
ncbi:hypothetical protein REPUB_Repub02eG0028700 [Reevesia pubescens]